MNYEKHRDLDLFAPSEDAVTKRKTPRGRRPGISTTAQAIRACAARAFGARGYEGVTVREIAALAGVDAALVHHYFGTKRALFAASLEVDDVAKSRPGTPVANAPGAGERLVREFLDRWDAQADGETIAGLLRTSGSDGPTAALVDDVLMRTIVAPAIAAIDPKRGMPTLRAQLIAAQLVGIAWFRYVLRVEPLASATSRIVAKTFGPSLDSTLAGRDYGAKT